MIAISMLSKWIINTKQDKVRRALKIHFCDASPKSNGLGSIYPRTMNHTYQIASGMLLYLRLAMSVGVKLSKSY